MWEREDHMHVARRQKFPAARLDPSVACVGLTLVGLTLGAVSISTRNGELPITCIIVVRQTD